MQNFTVPWCLRCESVSRCKTTMLIWFSDATLFMLNQSLAYCKLFSCSWCCIVMNILNHSITLTLLDINDTFNFRSLMTSKTIGMLMCGLMKNYWPTCPARTNMHYENTLFKYTENFTIKKAKLSDKKFWYFFHISALNIDCGYSLESPRRGASNEYPLSMFLSRIKKNNVYPCKPQFYYIKVGFKGVEII